MLTCSSSCWFPGYLSVPKSSQPSRQGLLTSTGSDEGLGLAVHLGSNPSLTVQTGTVSWGSSREGVPDTFRQAPFPHPHSTWLPERPLLASRESTQPPPTLQPTLLV